VSGRGHRWRGALCRARSSCLSGGRPTILSPPTPYPLTPNPTPTPNPNPTTPVPLLHWRGLSAGGDGRAAAAAPAGGRQRGVTRRGGVQRRARHVRGRRGGAAGARARAVAPLPGDPERALSCVAAARPSRNLPSPFSIQAHCGGEHGAVWRGLPAERDALQVGGAPGRRGLEVRDTQQPCWGGAHLSTRGARGRQQSSSSPASQWRRRPAPPYPVPPGWGRCSRSSCTPTCRPTRTSAAAATPSSRGRASCPTGGQSWCAPGRPGAPLPACLSARNWRRRARCAPRPFSDACHPPPPPPPATPRRRATSSRART
jgi:hypothetical protein